MEKYFIVPRESTLGKDYIEYLNNSSVAGEMYKDISKKYGIEANEFLLDISALGICPTKNDIEKFSHICKKRSNYASSDTSLNFKANSKISKEWSSGFIEKNIKSLSKPQIAHYVNYSFTRARSRIFECDSIIYGYIETNGEELNVPKDCVEIKASEYYKVIEEFESSQNVH